MTPRCGSGRASTAAGATRGRLTGCGAARDALQAATRDAVPEAELRRLLAEVRQLPEVDGADLRWRLAAPPERLLAVELVLAWYDVQERRPGRLRPCGNDECRLFLLDHSRANTARWCSMKTCGNRLKVRCHQADQLVRHGPGQRRGGRAARELAQRHVGE